MTERPYVHRPQEGARMASLLESRSSHRPVLAVVLLAVFFAFSLPQSLVNPVLPLLQAELHTTQSLITWVITAYLLSASILTPILGRLGDLYGRDRILLVALAALVGGSLVSAMAPEIGTMIVGRVLQGAGAGVLPLAFAIIRDEVPAARLPGAIGATAAIAAAGGGTGLVLAGPLVGALGIRSLFWIPLAMTVIVGVMTKAVIPPSRSRQTGSIRWLAPVLLAAWLTSLLLSLAQAPRWGWFSPMVIGLLVAAVVLAVSWVILESYSPSPLIDMRLMRVPAVWTTNLISLLMGVGLFSVFGFLPAFVQTSPEAGYGFGASVTEAGLLLLPMTMMMFVSGLMAARLVVRFGPRTMFVASTTLNVVALAMLAFQHDHRWQVLLAMALLGVAFGSAFTTISNVIVVAVPPGQTGVANGVTANIRTIGGSLGVALVGGIVSAYTPSGSLPTEDGYMYGFAAVALAGAIAAGISYLVPNQNAPTSA